MPNAFFDFCRNKRTGAGQNGVSVELIRQFDNTVLRTTDTAGVGNQTGSFGFSEQLYDYEGPTRIEATDSEGVVHVHTSQSVGQIGPWRATDLARAWQIMHDGVVRGVEGELLVTANGSDMVLEVNPGLAFAKGLVYWWPLHRHLTVPPNSSGSARTDLLALQFYPQGHLQEGRIDIVLLTDQPGSLVSSDAVPGGIISGADATTWFLLLANIDVGNGVSSISADRVADARCFSSGPLLDGSVTSDAISDQAVTFEKLALDLGPVFVTQVATNAETPSTSNLGAGHTVSALSTVVALPSTSASRWQITAQGDVNMKHSTDNQVLLTIEIEGQGEDGGRNPKCDSATWTTVRNSRQVANIPGNQNLFVRLRYCNTDSGVTSVLNPRLVVLAQRKS